MTIKAKIKNTARAVIIWWMVLWAGGCTFTPVLAQNLFSDAIVAQIRIDSYLYDAHRTANNLRTCCDFYKISSVDLNDEFSLLTIVYSGDRFDETYVIYAFQQSLVRNYYAVLDQKHTM